MSTEVAPGIFFHTRAELGLSAASGVGQSDKAEFIVHHSGGEQLGRVDWAEWWREIDRYHRSKGWNGAGYNFGIANDRYDSNVCHILEGRSWRGVGAHTMDHNTRGLGVCYLRNGAASNGVKRGIAWIYGTASHERGIPLTRYAHSDVFSTECCGDLVPWVHAGMRAPSFPGKATLMNLRSPADTFIFDPRGTGYWIVAADGGVFTYGGAQFFGSMGGKSLNAPIVGAAPHPSGLGYWLVGADGGVFAFGESREVGNLANKALNQPIVDMKATGTGRGYILLAADGGVFAFGDAEFHGAPVENIR